MLSRISEQLSIRGKWYVEIRCTQRKCRCPSRCVYKALGFSLASLQFVPQSISEKSKDLGGRIGDVGDGESVATLNVAVQNFQAFINGEFQR